MQQDKNIIEVFNLKEKKFLRRFDKCIELIKNGRKKADFFPSNIYDKMALYNSRPCRLIQMIIDADNIHQQIKP